MSSVLFFWFWGGACHSTPHPYHPCFVRHRWRGLIGVNFLLFLCFKRHLMYGRESLYNSCPGSDVCKPHVLFLLPYSRVLCSFPVYCRPLAVLLVEIEIVFFHNTRLSPLCSSTSGRWQRTTSTPWLPFWRTPSWTATWFTAR